MQIGVPKEIKTREYRVGLTPAGVHTLVEDGHTLLVERGAGAGSGFSDELYSDAGASLVDTAAEVYGEAQLVVKVKEPLPAEYGLLQKSQLLFTYLHLAPAAELTRALLERGVTGIAYETVQMPDGSLPLLTPMSLIAGRMSVQVGAHWLEKGNGGRGVLLAGAPGVPPGKVVILGGGVVGSNAARIAVGLGAEVTLLDISPTTLSRLEERFGNRVRTQMAHPQAIAEEVSSADLVIGAVLVPGARAPILVPESLVASMPQGSVIVDVAVDQGGCVATTRPTTHDAPVYTVHGVIHYGVANMPGAVSRTSALALTGSTLPYVRRLAAGGLDAARKDEPLRLGVNVHDGKVCNPAVAEAQKLPLEPFSARPGGTKK